MPVNSREDHDLGPRELYGVFLRRVEQGEDADFSELCAQYPQFADQLRKLHGAQETVHLHPHPSDAASPHETAEVGVTQVGRYGRRQRLARGGMGVIYKVWDNLLRRRLAMKIVKQQDPSLSSGQPVDPQVLARFVREAEITARLDHPGVVPIHDLGVDEIGRVFFTMRLIQGKSLTAVIEQARRGADRWTQTRVIDVIIKVCETVAFAHARGIIHRDLKPDNVMVGAFGETYVMDWGLAKLTRQPDEEPEPDASGQEIPVVKLPASSSGSGSTGAVTATEMGCVLGTAWYMPPEQASGRTDELDERTDIYSVGAILYELLCGQRPYAVSGKAMTFDDVVTAVLAGPPRPITEINRRVPAELAAICDKAMARDKSSRYPTMLDMADDLRAYVESRVVRAYQTGAAAELKKWVKRNRGLAIAGVLVFLVSVCGLAAVIVVQSWANDRLSRANDDILAANKKIVEESEQKQAALRQKTAALDAAEQERRRAEGLYLAQQSSDVVAKNPGQALLLALESHRRRPGFEANSALLAALGAPRELRTMHGHRRPIRSMSLSRDGKRLITRANERTSYVWDLATAKPVICLIGIDDHAYCVETSPNNRWIVTTWRDGSAAVLDSQTGKLLRVLTGHTGRVCQASFSPDSRTLATGALDATVRLWDAETGVERRVLAGHEAEINSIAFSPDGALVITGSVDRTARLWNAETGVVLHVLDGHLGGVARTVFTPDGKHVVTAAWHEGLGTVDGVRQRLPSSDTELRIWNAATGELEHKLEHQTVVKSFAFGEATGRIAAGCADGSVTLWNLSTRLVEHHFRAAPAGIVSLAFSPDERTVAAGATSGGVYLLDTVSGGSAGERLGHSGEVTAVAFTSDNELLTASRDQTVRAWSTRAAHACPPASLTRTGAAAVVSGDGLRLVVVPRDRGALRLFVLPDVDLVAELNCESEVRSAFFSPDAKSIATLSVSGRLDLWSSADGDFVATVAERHVKGAVFRDAQHLVVVESDNRSAYTWSLPEGRVIKRLALPGEQLNISPDGRFLLAWDHERPAEVWSTDRGERIADLDFTLNGPREWLVPVFSPDGTVLATLTQFRPQPRLWDTVSGRPIATLDTGERTTVSVSLSRDGGMMLTSSAVTIARTWNARTGAALAVLSGFEPTSALSIVSPSGNRVVITSNEGLSRLWDGASGRMLQIMGEHDEAVTKAWFSADGKRLLTMNRPMGRSVLWNALPGERVAELESGMQAFDDAVFTPDGRWFVTTYADGSARVWPADPAALVDEEETRPWTPDERDFYRLVNDVERRKYRLIWNQQELVDFLVAAGRVPIASDDQRQIAAAGIAARINEFLGSLLQGSPREHIAALAEVEEILNRVGGLAPIIRLTLADAYRQHGGTAQAARLLEGSTGEAEGAASP